MRVGPGGLVSLGCAALVFSDVSRFSSSLATTSLMAVRVGNDARGMPGNPSSRLAFSMAVEVCRGAAWPLARA